MFAALASRLSRWNIAFGIYAIVSVAAPAGLLFTPGTIGHHWYRIVPSDPSERRRPTAIQARSWQDFDL
ncbi:MAG: hypothetical protein WB615_04095 [Candidatus Tumulicola sp.]